jgi:hypothetical protein
MTVQKNAASNQGIRQGEAATDGVRACLKNHFILRTMGWMLPQAGDLPMVFGGQGSQAARAKQQQEKTQPLAAQTSEHSSLALLKRLHQIRQTSVGVAHAFEHFLG